MITSFCKYFSVKEPNFPLKKKIKNSKDMQIRDNIDALNLDIPYKRDDFFIIGNQSSFSFSLLPYKLRPVPSRVYLIFFKFCIFYAKINFEYK